MITGTVETSRNNRSVSKPSSSGIITSSTTTSGSSSRTLFSASNPLPAWMTRKPSSSRFIRMNWIMRGSSSTTRMVCLSSGGMAERLRDEGQKTKDERQWTKDNGRKTVAIRRSSSVGRHPSLADEADNLAFFLARHHFHKADPAPREDHRHRRGIDEVRILPIALAEIRDQQEVIGGVGQFLNFPQHRVFIVNVNQNRVRHRCLPRSPSPDSGRGGQGVRSIAR